MTTRKSTRFVFINYIIEINRFCVGASIVIRTHIDFSPSVKVSPLKFSKTRVILMENHTLIGLHASNFAQMENFSSTKSENVIDLLLSRKIQSTHVRYITTFNSRQNYGRNRKCKHGLKYKKISSNFKYEKNS